MKFPVIYAIKCNEKYLYIGHSVNFKQRKRDHNTHIRNYQNCICQKKLYQELNKIGVYNLEWEILEEVFSFDEDILKECERFFIEFLFPIYNKDIPGRTEKESQKNWVKNNPEKKIKIKKSIKKWHEDNKDKYSCEKCGFNSYSKTDYTIHCKTKKHLKKNS